MENESDIDKVLRVLKEEMKPPLPLRCISCGRPLPYGDKFTATIKCNYCGYINSGRDVKERGV